MVDEEYADAEALYGLSPGFLRGRKADEVDDGIMLGAADEARSKSATLTLCDSLLEGPWGRLRILRDASCVSEARLAGLSRTDALPESTRGGSSDTAEGFADDVVIVPLVSAGGAVLLRQRPRPEKPKMLLFLAGDSMLAMGGGGKWNGQTRRGREKGVLQWGRVADGGDDSSRRPSRCGGRAFFFVAVACRGVAAASVEGVFQASGVNGQRRARIGGRWSFFGEDGLGDRVSRCRWRKEATKIKDGKEENRNRWVQ